MAQLFDKVFSFYEVPITIYLPSQTLSTYGLYSIQFKPSVLVFLFLLITCLIMLYKALRK